MARKNTEVSYQMHVLRRDQGDELFQKFGGSCRREFTDRILFWSEADLEAKLRLYMEFFNAHRVHYAHGGKTPAEIVGDRGLAKIDVANLKWKSVCGGLLHAPIAA